MKRTFFFVWLYLFLALGVVTRSYALEYIGRASLGGFISHEQHEPEPQGQDSNDFATTSARLFYRAQGFGGDDDLVFTTDLRDKNDFFNKLDKEKKELTNENTMQLRQASVRKDEREHGLIWEVGRYAITNAGSAFNDGATLGWKFSSPISTELFGGLNPKRYDTSYLEYNSDATIYGIVFSYMPSSEKWTMRKELNMAYVTQNYLGETDRQYLYQQSVYQWNTRSFLSSLFYLDFVPRTYVQNAQLLYYQGWSRPFSTQLGIHAFDVIEYRRRQDLRETLTASPYQEASLKSIYATNATSQWSLTTRYGRREIDDLERIHFVLENTRPRYFSKNIDFAARIAQKKEFTKNGTFAGVSLGHYTDKTEYEIILDAGTEKQTDDTTLHPVIVELNNGFQISRRFFGGAGLQYQKDEKVEIYSAYFKVSYRFGNKETPPIRDGAPPRGRM